MEMQQIRYFLTLAQTLNFTRAAEACNVSQPALTRAVKQLEEELGGELIRREGRLSHLTDLGHKMLPLIRQCYESAQSAKALAQAVRTGESASVSIAVARAFDVDLLMGPLSRPHDGYPGLQLKLRRGDGRQISEMLKSGEIELAVGGPLAETWDRLDAWPMFTESFDLVVGAGHELAVRNELELDVELVRGARFLVQMGADLSDDQISRLAEFGITLRNAHQVDTDRDLAALLEANFGVAIAPASALRLKTLRHLSFAGLDLRRTVAIYTVAGRPRTPEATTLINLLRAADWTLDSP